MQKQLATTALTAAIVSTMASATAAQGLALEEIIVTAQKRTESVRDIPSTVNALTDEQLQDFNVFDLESIESLSAGLQLNKLDARRQTITIRGITADPDNVAKQPISIYWNGVPVRSQVGFSAIYDLERIEVLRGPQGTLQGRTDPAGAILMYTRRPNASRTDGYIQQTFSDNEGSNTQFAASLPIIENKLAVRLSGVFDENEGQGIENITTGQGQQNRNKSGRLSVDWLPTDNFSAMLTYQHIEKEVDFPEPIEGTPGALAAINPGLAGLDLDVDDRFAIHQGINENIERTDFVSLNLEWTLAGHTLTSVTGWHRWNQDNVIDIDIANVLPLPQMQRTQTDDKSVIQELRLASDTGQFWEYLVGAYYEDSKSGTTNSTDVSGSFALGGLPVAPGDVITAIDIPIENKTWAVFTHNTFNLTDATNLQIGVRYQEVERFNRADATFVNKTFLPDAFLQTALPFGPLINDDQSDDKASAVTGGLTLSHHLNPDIMVYGSYNRSFRPAGVTVTPTPLSGDTLLFDEETSDAYELGFKSTLADGRFQLNGALFYQVYDGYLARADQIAARVPDTGEIVAVLGGLTYNADTIVQGVEFDFSGQLTETWSFGGGFSYTDSRFDDGVKAPCNAPIPPGAQVATCLVEGDRVSALPDFAVNLRTEYYVPLGDTEWFIRGLYNFTSEQDNRLVKGEVVPSYATLNLYTGLRADDGSWSVEVWAENVTDREEKAFVSNPIFFDAGGTVLESNFRRNNLIQPRTIGITARYNFSS